MSLIGWSLGCLAAGALAGLLGARAPRLAAFGGACGAVAAALAGLVPAGRVLVGGTTLSWSAAWPMPGGAWRLALDPLSAVFLIPMLLVPALAAVYGAAAPAHGRPGAARAWFWFNLLTACLVLVVLSRNGLLFLLAWEGMSLASFFLVLHDGARPESRQAAGLYLVAMHVGAAFLLVFFALAGRGALELDFERLHAAAPAFLLALIGFGTKAGFVPLHVWLPEAHPAAPSHVSAVMSAVMIKAGIYGLFRALSFLGPPPAWWGWVFVGIGLSSALLGVVYALAQHDLKRLLAYHSVENIGIIALGMGVGLVGLSAGRPLLAQLGMAGALLHVINHALFKSLLFLGAGAVAQRCGTRELDRLGGLARRMPWTALAFLVGAAAIAGLPPLNGFVSEFLIYLGAALGGLRSGPANGLPGVGILVGLACVGALAAACFAKAFGIVFLGEPRTGAARDAREVGWAMRIPMLLLAAACAAVGLGAPWIGAALRPAVAAVTGSDAAQVFAGAERPLALLARVQAGSLALVVMAALLAGLRRWRLSGLPVRTAGTWDCGYPAPTPRMQYTASSFALGFVDAFQWVLRTKRRRTLPRGYFPESGSMATETTDGFRDLVFQPLFERVTRALAALHWLQHGRLQWYILAMALTLVALLVWYAGRLG